MRKFGYPDRKEKKGKKEGMKDRKKEERKKEKEGGRDRFWTTISY